MSDDERAARELHLDHVLGLIALEPPEVDLVRLCRAAASYLGSADVAVTLLGRGGADAVAAASGPRARQYVEMQLTAGEGPCLDARRTARPVLVPDLHEAERGRWPGYLALATEAGVGAVFALPLHVGAVQLGVLDLYAEHPTHLTDEQVATLLAFARVATEIVLDGSAPELDDRDPLASLDYHPEVYQAQGMLMISLQVSLADALVRMRAHAFAHRSSLSDLAREIIAGRVFDDGEI